MSASLPLVPLFSEVIHLLDVCEELQLHLKLSDILVQLVLDGDAKVLILDILMHGALHFADYPTHENLSHVIDLNAWVREEQFWQILKEEAQKRVLEY